MSQLHNSTSMFGWHYNLFNHLIILTEVMVQNVIFEKKNVFLLSSGTIASSLTLFKVVSDSCSCFRFNLFSILTY